MSLRNIRRERFALELYAGKHPTDAYALAGFTTSPKSGAANARKLANDPDIRARIDAHFAEEWGLAAVQAARLRREREIIAYSNIVDYFEPALDADGNATGRVKIKDFTKLPRELTAALRSIKPTKLGWEVTLHDKDASLRAIEERIDPVAKRMELTGPGGGPMQITDGDAARERIAERLKTIARRTTDDPADGSA